MNCLFAAAVSLMTIVSCGSSAEDIPDWNDFGPDNGKEEEQQGSKIPDDMVLLYGGGHHRTPYNWDAATLEDYVICTLRNGEKKWLFDGFLMLEFMDAGANGSGRTFITGYSYNGTPLPSARREEWENLADYYFTKGAGFDALSQAVASASVKMGGSPSTSRKVVVGIPEPVRNAEWNNSSSTTVYWGTLDGRQLDFSKTVDRLAACKWYIDRVEKNFKSGDYPGLELAGFYWVAEKATQSRDLMSDISEYLDDKGYTFNWIPYFGADGFSDWKSYGFDCAYLQPNYFFTTSVPYSRLEEACRLAKQYGMGLEVEFDGNAMESNASSGKNGRLNDYMNAFKASGLYETVPLAYYQGSWALRWLQHSSSEADRALYYDFCEFVTGRHSGRE